MKVLERVDENFLWMTTTGHWWHAAWVHVWTQHHKRHIHCTSVTRKFPCHQQDTVHVFCWYGKGIEKKTCLKMQEAECMSIATWVKRSVWKWVFTKALAWTTYCSSWFWKPSPKSFVHNVYGKTCMQMTWPSSLNRWRNCERSWSSRKLIWKERDFGSIMAKAMFHYCQVRCVSEIHKDPRAVCLKGVYGNNFCGGCYSWDHKRSSGIPDPLRPDSSWRCKQCTGQARPVDGRPIPEGREKLQLVALFCYLRDC